MKRNLRICAPSLVLAAAPLVAAPGFAAAQGATGAPRLMYPTDRTVLPIPEPAYIKDGKPTYTYNWLGLQRSTVSAPQALPPGKATIRYELAALAD